MTRLTDWWAGWHEEHDGRPRPAVWSIRCDEFVATLYTVDADFEDTTVLAVLLEDRFGYRTRPSTRPGVTRFDLDPPREFFAPTEDKAQGLIDILAHNGVHGWCWASGTKERRRF